jgi:hypothetical protein
VKNIIAVSKDSFKKILLFILMYLVWVELMIILFLVIINRS